MNLLFNRRLILLLIFTLTLPQFYASADSSSQRKRREVSNRSNNLLARMGVQQKSFSLQNSRNGNMFFTNLDSMRELVILARRITLGISLMNLKGISERNYAQGKMQDIIPDSVPFPCALNNTRSPEPPTSVHRVRPGDIDVIMAFGDSLSAGNGIMSDRATDMINEYRGLTFCGGGISTWRRYLTLPNILKVFNPKLYGYSIANALMVDRELARLNIAEPMLMSHDLPYVAHVLVDRLRRDKNVDMKNHWKVLTIFVGNNDVCSDMCHWDSERELLEHHEQSLRRAFTTLRDNVPRLIINLMPVSNMFNSVAQMTPSTLQCALVHHIGCNCVIGSHMTDELRERMFNRIARWHHIDEFVASLPEFQTDDFSVIFHHSIMGNTSLPTMPDGKTDFRFFAHDCFHFSQRGHASVANMLWNSMLLPRELRPSEISAPFMHFQCPSEEMPYIMTPQNEEAWRTSRIS